MSNNSQRQNLKNGVFQNLKYVEEINETDEFIQNLQNVDKILTKSQIC